MACGEFLQTLEFRLEHVQQRGVVQFDEIIDARAADPRRLVDVATSQPVGASQGAGLAGCRADGFGDCVPRNVRLQPQASPPLPASLALACLIAGCIGGSGCQHVGRAGI